MKVIFVDIDGTLYDHFNKVGPESALLAVEKAREKGHKVIICTGRSLCQSRQFINLPFDGYIFGAGTVVYAEKKLLFKKSFEVEEVYQLIDFFNEHNIQYCIEGDFGAYYNNNAVGHLKKYFCDEDLDMKETIKVLNENGLFDMSYYDERDCICKMCLYGGKPEDFDLLYKNVNDYSLTVSFIDEEKNMRDVELSLKGYNKSTAAKIVLDHYGLGFEDAIAIGDSDNDYEIIRDCGIGIAMGNAHPRELEIADYITDDVDKDGVYKAFEHFNLI